MKRILIAILKILNLPRIVIACLLISLAHISPIVKGDMKRLNYRYDVCEDSFGEMLAICLSRDRIFQTILEYRLTDSHKIFGYIYRVFFPTRRKDIEIWSKIGGSIGEGLTIYHGYGTIINCMKAGKNLSVYQGVTIGKNGRGDDDLPEIGDNVIIYSNAVVVGKIRIGDNVVIGANTVVNKDIPANSIVYPGIPFVKEK